MQLHGLGFLRIRSTPSEGSCRHSTRLAYHFRDGRVEVGAGIGGSLCNGRVAQALHRQNLTAQLASFLHGLVQLAGGWLSEAATLPAPTLGLTSCLTSVKVSSFFRISCLYSDSRARSSAMVSCSVAASHGRRLLPHAAHPMELPLTSMYFTLACTFTSSSAISFSRRRENSRRELASSLKEVADCGQGPSCQISKMSSSSLDRAGPLPQQSEYARPPWHARGSLLLVRRQ